MAKIVQMPGQEIIDGFKGTIDYYVHDGVACVRRWPRRAVYRRSPAELATEVPFAFASSYYNNLAPAIRKAWNAMAAGAPVTGRDIFTKSFISGDAISEEED